MNLRKGLKVQKDINIAFQYIYDNLDTFIHKNHIKVPLISIYIDLTQLDLIYKNISNYLIL